MEADFWVRDSRAQNSRIRVSTKIQSELALELRELFEIPRASSFIVIDPQHTQGQQSIAPAKMGLFVLTETSAGYALLKASGKCHNTHGSFAQANVLPQTRGC